MRPGAEYHGAASQVPHNKCPVELNNELRTLNNQNISAFLKLGRREKHFQAFYDELPELRLHIWTQLQRTREVAGKKQGVVVLTHADEAPANANEPRRE